jgi:putative membrane protein
MRNIFLVALFGTALAAAPAYAQYSKAGSAEKSTTSKSVTAPDRTFVKKAAEGGLAEVELGNLAKDKASSPDVKQFGDRMATDHGKANDQLKDWAQKENVTLPTALTAKDKATRDRLSKLSGDAFDKAYMQEMVKDHQKDVTEFQKESKAAKDADLKAWAGQTLPTLQDHLKMARDTASKVGASTSGATGTSGHKKHHKKSGSGGKQ